ncbi:MAG: hypothetical protein R3344_00050 [Acidobacteriota bacterium]|nr:hypothetical protein [Acidobacteriota bacterium]
MRKFIGMTGIVVVLLIAAGGPASGAEICDGVGTTFLDDVIVPAGATCDFGFGGDIVFGDVTLEPGATLVKDSGPLAILGDVRGTDIESLQIGGCDVMGGIDIDGAAGNVSIAACSVNASVNIQGVAGVLRISGCEIGHRLRVIRNVGDPGTDMNIASNTVDGDIVINDNEHTLTANIDSNKLSGRLTCRNNVPPPSSKGSDGTIALRGQEGQCADLP